MSTSYRPDDSGEFRWCTTHKRQATFLRTRYANTPDDWVHVCEPGLGGITIPCEMSDTPILSALRQQKRGGAPTLQIEHTSEAIQLCAEMQRISQLPRDAGDDLNNIMGGLMTFCGLPLSVKAA